MNTDSRSASIVERVCQIPAEFYKGGKSFRHLIKESGLEAAPSALTVEAAFAYFVRHPALVDQWIRWSESKRVASGWYLRRFGNGYEVGFYPNGVKMHFGKPDVACAEFVIREVTAIQHTDP